MERETKCIQAGYEPKNGEPRMIPIIQSTTFKYDTSEDMGKLFDLEAFGYFYTRRCPRRPGRRLPSTQYLTSAARATTSCLHRRSTAARTIYLPLR